MASIGSRRPASQRQVTSGQLPVTNSGPGTVLGPYNLHIAFSALLNMSSIALLQRYQRWRHVAEPGFWIVLYLSQAMVNSWLVWLDLHRSGLATPFWEAAVWEWSSNMVLLALVPVVIFAEQFRPLQLVFERKNLRWHLAASVVYSLVHVAAMVSLRKLAY